ncbi:PREDICTED: CD9 antigen [Atta cephalotes]|uniref:Tetraspanin n=2 Tax=Atta TaxID=12956 RepID=A0A158NVU1_ATTCE|nr:PREDICTED: CD9 antigen [Atta cephalotes]XP_018049755.1 PREDICTED: CD9 antigen [Atta colombica]KYM81792.1 Tetraspanin-11 [Atta colombica]
MGTFCYNFSKYSLAAISLVFLIISVTVITMVACMLSDRTYLVSIAEEGNNYEAGLYILLFTGILMLIVSILGWCSALKLFRYCLATFISIMLVIVVAQIAFAGWLYAHKDRLDELVRSSVINTVKDEYGEIQCRTQIMDTIQSTLECCGANGPEDWAGSKYGKQDSSQIRLNFGVSNAENIFRIPKSCCKDTDSTACNQGRQMKVAGVVSSAIYSEGCMEKLVTTLKTQTYHFMGAAVLVLALEIVSLILALICCYKGGSSDRYKA